MTRGSIVIFGIWVGVGLGGMAGVLDATAFVFAAIATLMYVFATENL